MKKYNIKALRQKRVDLNGRMQTILDAAKNGDRELNEEESRRFNILKTEGAHLAVEIDEAEQEIESERVESERLIDLGQAVNVSDREAQLAKPGGPAKLLRKRAPIGVAGHGRKYAELFASTPLDRGGFDDFEDYLRSIHSGRFDPRLQLQATAMGMTGTVPTEGGFLVPTEFAAEMLDASLEAEIVRPRARVFPMGAPTRKISGFDNLDHSGGLTFGGFSITWLGEGGVGTPDKAKTRLIELNAQKLALYTIASNELVADGMTFAEILGPAMIGAAGWGLDTAFLSGNGVGKPLGVLNDNALIVVAKETSQPNATIVYPNVAKMFARMYSAGVNNSVWVANPTTIPQLLQMQNVVKNVAGSENVGGSAVPVVTQEGGKFSMLTRPILFTEKLPALGAQGDLLLADFSQYAVGIRKELSIEKSIHLGFMTDESTYRAIMRVDGQGRWDRPFTPLSGDPLSWCITLAKRSA